MRYQRLNFALGVLLSAFVSCAVADEKAVMLDDNLNYCNVYAIFTGGKKTPPPERGCRKKRGGIREPQSIALPDKVIHFEFGSADILPASTDNLNILVAVIQDMKQENIRIDGHTDSVGTADYNQWLSEQRALSVKRYLVNHGVASRRIQTAGFGFNKLHDPDHPEDEINRRVEFANLGE